MSSGTGGSGFGVVSLRWPSMTALNDWVVERRFGKRGGRRMRVLGGTK